MRKFNEIKLLAWKHFCLLKHYWILSSIEFLSPIALVSMVVFGQLLFADPPKTTVDKPTAEGEMLMTPKTFFNYVAVVYTPRTFFTVKIMERVKKNLNLLAAGSIKDESTLITFLSTSRGTSLVGVVFSQTSNYTYKIRDKHTSWRTQELFDKSEAVRNKPSTRNIYSTTIFIHLQIEINKMIIAAVIEESRSEGRLYQPNSGKSIATDGFEIQFGAFPYPEFTKLNSKHRTDVLMAAAFALIIGSFLLLGPIMLFIMREKGTGIFAFLEVLGIEEWLLWISGFIVAFGPSIAVYSAITFLLHRKFSDTHYAVFIFAQPSVIWIYLILYCLANITFGFAFCAIFHSFAAAISYFLIISISIAFIAFNLDALNYSVLIKLSCLIPAGAFVEGFRRIQYYEILGVPLSWRNMTITELNAVESSLSFVLFMFIIDSVIYTCLTLYFHLINHGKFGHGKSPLFIFQRDTHRGPFYKPKTTSISLDINLDANEKYFESVSKFSDAIIQMTNIERKINNITVKTGTLTVLKNDLFVLLGKRGSGKTTVLSILIGLRRPSSGSIVYKKSVDVLNHEDLFRKDIGYCPQEDRLLPYLDVKEHLIFYSLLKGYSKQDAETEASRCLALVNLDEFAIESVLSISEAMKRQLCLAIALIGNPEVLILDEPIDGVDFITKQMMWNLFTELRKQTTIILTSSDMQEAEAIGNRIAIINDGVVVCCGTVEFLRNVFDVGFQLKVTRYRDPSSVKKSSFPALVDVISKNISNVKVLTRSANEFHMILPFSETGRFPVLFKLLEKNMSNFSIERISVTSSSLEEIFYKLDEPYFFTGRRPKMFDPFMKHRKSDQRERLFGVQLAVVRLRALLLKKYLYVLRNWIIFFSHVFIPSLLMAFLLTGSSAVVNPLDPALELSFPIIYPKSKIMLLKNDFSNKDLYLAYNTHINELQANVIQRTEKDIITALVNYGKENINSYHRDVILASDLNIKSKKVVKLLYNPWALHSLPIAINVWMNAVFKYESKNASASLKTINHPLQQFSGDNSTIVQRDTIVRYSPTLMMWYVLLGFFSVDLLYYFAIPANEERLHGFKHIQIMTGVSYQVYWFSNLIFDTSFFVVLTLLRYLLMRQFDRYDFFAFRYDTLVIGLILILFAISGLLFIYVVTYDLYLRPFTYIIFFIFNLFGALLALLYYSHVSGFLEFGPDDFLFLKPISGVVRIFLSIIPPFNFYVAMGKFIIVWTVNNWFKSFIGQNLDIGQHSHILHQENSTELSYFEFQSSENPHGILNEIIIFVLEILVYCGILFVMEQGYIDKFSSFVISKVKKRDSKKFTVDDIHLDEDLELRHVPVVVGKRNALTVHRLHKVYLTIPPVVGVKDVTFIVKAGECFALVGQKNAGKSTLIKMLTGESVITRGKSWIFDLSLSENTRAYMKRCGYCAENDYFLEELSAKELLNLIAALRGINDEERNDITYDWIYNLGLDSVQDYKSGTYSRGNKKKLGTALSMIGEPSVVFLDEPTAGVDSASKRRLYEAIELGKSKGQAVIMSTTNLQECVLICDQLTLLVDGTMKFIGSVEGFRRKYAEGYSVKIKIRSDLLEETVEIMNKIKTDIADNYYVRSSTWILKRENDTHLHYRIKNVSSLWSEIFEMLENLKKKFPSISMYLLDEVPLDENLLVDNLLYN